MKYLRNELETMCIMVHIWFVDVLGDYQMTEKTQIEFWLAFNEDGDAEVHMEGPTEAREALVENAGGAAIRVVKITAAVTLPVIAECEVDVPDEAGETVAAAA
jgi:hypothetical protein